MRLRGFNGTTPDISPCPAMSFHALCVGYPPCRPPRFPIHRNVFLVIAALSARCAQACEPMNIRIRLPEVRTRPVQSYLLDWRGGSSAQSRVKDDFRGVGEGVYIQCGNRKINMMSDWAEICVETCIPCVPCTLQFIARRQTSPGARKPTWTATSHFIVIRFHVSTIRSPSSLK